MIFSRWCIPTPLIPVLVTGIQPTRVCAARKVLSTQKDLGWLDLCDEQRDEGG
jgi:hypothetical protein